MSISCLSINKTSTGQALKGFLWSQTAKHAAEIANFAQFAHLSAEMAGERLPCVRRIDILCRREARLHLLNWRNFGGCEGDCHRRQFVRCCCHCWKSSSDKTKTIEPLRRREIQRVIHSSIIAQKFFRNGSNFQTFKLKLSTKRMNKFVIYTETILCYI